MNHYFVVCDQEKSYVERFTALLNERGMVPYQIQGISDVTMLESFCKEHIVEVLLVEEDLYQEHQRRLPAKKVFPLTELPAKEKEGCLFKYQPVSAIIGQVMKTVDNARELPPKTGARIIAVYSPVRGNEKTVFALALGQILAREQGVIYLNYSSLTGLSELLEGNNRSDLADVLYFLSQGKKDYSYWQKSIGTINNLDYILPVLSPLDLRSAKSQHWLDIVEQLQEWGEYQTILVELDESCEAYLQILQRCETIYMPLREDRLSKAQRRQYEQLMYGIGEGALVKKTVFVKPPFHNGFGNKGQFVEQLIWGELGDYVRSLLWGK